MLLLLENDSTEFTLRQYSDRWSDSNLPHPGVGGFDIIPPAQVLRHDGNGLPAVFDVGNYSIVPDTAEIRVCVSVMINISDSLFHGRMGYQLFFTSSTEASSFTATNIKHYNWAY